MGRGWCQSNCVVPPLAVGAGEVAVGDGLDAPRHGDVEVVGRLVRGLSLQGNHDGEPCGSSTTKAPSAVATQPSSDPSGSVIGLRRAGVVDHDGERRAGRQRRGGRDDQLLLQLRGLGERGRPAVDGDRGDGEGAPQVEVEAGQRLAWRWPEGGDAGQRPGAGV